MQRLKKLIKQYKITDRFLSEKTGIKNQNIKKSFESDMKLSSIQAYLKAVEGIIPENELQKTIIEIFFNKKQ